MPIVIQHMIEKRTHVGSVYFMIGHIGLILQYQYLVSMILCKHQDYYCFQQTKCHTDKLEVALCSVFATETGFRSLGWSFFCAVFLNPSIYFALKIFIVILIKLCHFMYLFRLAINIRVFNVREHVLYIFHQCSCFVVLCYFSLKFVKLKNCLWVWWQC